MTPAPHKAASGGSGPVVDSDGVRFTLLTGYAVIALLTGGVGVWAAVTPIMGAVIANATAVVDSNVKKVQHLQGGVVGEIHVRDGDRVKTGDLLIRLDETITRANLQVVVKQLNELTVRLARLDAERDEARSITIPPAIMAKIADPDVAAIIAGEQKLFDSRRSGREGQKSMLRERIAQIRQELAGVDAVLASRTRELKLVKTELAAYHQLWTKNLISIAKYTASQREESRLLGESNQFTTQLAQLKGKVAEIELQILQIDQDLRTEVIRDSREAQAKTAELVERQVAAEDTLKRIDIRAPDSGVVHLSSVHTIGGVITANDPVMLIVPEHESLVLEARFTPQDIDSVRVGHKAFIRLTAFNQQTTPEFEGRVARVSADLMKDQQTGLPFYMARITISPEELKKAPHITLIPGMPAEVHIQTAQRTALSYLIKPLTDQFARAFKER